MATRVNNDDFRKVYSFQAVLKMQTDARIKYCFVCDPEGKKEVCNYGVFCNNPRCRETRCHVIGHGVCLTCCKMACKFPNCKKINEAEHKAHYCHHTLEARRGQWMNWIAFILTNEKTKYKINNMLDEELEEVKAYARADRKKREQEEKKKMREVRKKSRKADMVYTKDEEGNYILVDKKEEDRKREEERKRRQEEEEAKKREEEYFVEFPAL